MMKENFEAALACVLVHEGGKDDDPRDPGGRTAYGVIQRRYNQYRKAKGLPVRDVWLITPDERSEIYRVYYWDVSRGADLPAGLDYCVFDACVNSGDGQAAKWLQRAINDVRAKSGQGAIAVDGRIGDGTVQAANAIDDVDAVIAAMSDRRLAMLQNLKTWKYYGKGWGRRVSEVKKLSQAVARGSVAAPTPAGWVTAPEAPLKTSPKAMLSDAKSLPSPDKGTIAAAIGGASSAVSTTTSALQPAQGIHPAIDTALHVLIILGILATLAGAAWAAWANSQAKRMAEDLGLTAPVPAETDAMNDNAGPDHLAVAPGEAA
ncbi:glycosyl hydrolase 108 family protein [Xanthobacter sp. V0B-10]|uniref:glycoside hydrolase family 108 protein n=1 Tax=Xanthobacter albus TaxID=3119929 RepID=UPI003727FA50